MEQTSTERHKKGLVSSYLNSAHENPSYHVKPAPKPLLLAAHTSEGQRLLAPDTAPQDAATGLVHSVTHITSLLVA